MSVSFFERRFHVDCAAQHQHPQQHQHHHHSIKLYLFAAMSRLVRSLLIPSTGLGKSFTSKLVIPASSLSLRSFASSSKGKLEVISSPDAPKAIGPYSQAIKANGFIFVSGSLGLDPKTSDFPAKEIVAQTKQSLENIKAILAAGGSSMDKVVKTTILLADIKDFPKVNEVYASYFSGNFPARATYAVKDLPKGALVEIEAIATA
jgi:2-iminobutanoate/2-iminopropanoate deaminase